MRTVAIAAGTALGVSALLAVIWMPGDGDPGAGAELAELRARVEALEREVAARSSESDSGSTGAPERSPEEQEAHDRTVLRWIERLGSEDEEVAFNATLELGKLKDRRADAALISALETHDDHYVRLGAAAALGEIGAVTAILPLIDALDAEDTLVRTAANDALQAITKASVPFRADGSTEERRRAQEAWRAWYADHEPRLRER